MCRYFRLGALGLLLAAATALLGAEPPPLRIGMMPAVDSAPLVVAERLGAFARRGLRVELELFQDQLAREASLQAGRIDGSVSDLVNAVSARAGGFDVRAVSSTDGLFALLGSPAGPAGSIDDWRSPSVRSVRTGLLETSIVSYVTEKMLLAAGADSGKVELVPVLQLPARLELLLAGRLEAACLPEPLVSVALARGARLIADTRSLDSTPGVLLFTARALRDKADAVASLLEAWDEAVEALNRGPSELREVVAGRLGFPDAVRGSFILPRFRRASPPTQEEADDVMAWMRARGLISRPLPYAELVAVVRRP